MAKLYFSVVIPSYNNEDTIVASVKSVLEQVDEETIVIVVDDCSTDETIKRISMVNDQRLKIVQNKVNAGANIRRNQGVSLFPSEYVFFHDADDVWISDKFFEFCSKISAHPGKKLFFSRYLRSYNEVEAVIPKESIEHLQSSYEELIPYKNILGAPTICVKSAFFHCIGGFDENLPKFQDWEFAIRAFSLTDPVIIDKPLTKAKVYDSGITQNTKLNAISYFLIFKKHFTASESRIQAHWAKLILYSALVNHNYFVILKMLAYPRAVFFALKSKFFRQNITTKSR